ncbi:MAG: hypothetical protein OHK0039_16790 [Bacteroidia bacterium]
MARLFALLIGIDAYQCQRPLGGCVQDIRKVDAYLRQYTQDSHDYQPLLLLDEAATRAGVIGAFERHLIAQAGAGDVALLYYSGHGGQEQAASWWARSEADLRLEGIVCHDSGPSGQPILADKELRHLIHRLAGRGCEVLTIFDCCHAGDNTRSSQPPSDLPVRRIAEIAPQRAYADFLFAGQVAEQDLRTRVLEEVLPQGRHVHLAACQDFELAYEDRDGGMFTRYLLETLRETQGKRSYYDLLRRVRYRVQTGSAGVAQTPQLYVLREHAQDAFRDFLSGATRNRPLGATLLYNTRQQLWLLDRGAIHGIPRSTAPGNEAQILLMIDGGKPLQGFVQAVHTASSVIRFEAAVEAQLDRQRSYEAWVGGLMSEPLYIAVAGLEAGVQVFRAYADSARDRLADKRIYLAAPGQTPHYQVLAQTLAGKQHYALTLPGDTRPLCMQVFGFEARSAAAVVADLQDIARWQFVFDLRNPEDETLPPDALRLDVVQGSATVQPDAGGVVTLDYEDLTAKFASRIGVSLTNTTDRTLYVACVYMDTDFSMRPDLLEQKVVRLEAGQTVHALGGRSIPVTRDRIVEAYNWPHDRFFFQTICGTHPFEVDAFVQKGLTPPLTPDRFDDTRSASRSLAWDEEEADPTASLESWRTRRFEIRFRNPTYRPDQA